MRLAGPGMSAIGPIPDNRAMVNYVYQRIHGHLILNIGGRPCLLDTGSPLSVGYEPITVSGREFHLHDNYLGVNGIYLTEHIGTNIEALIGADIIKEFTLGIFPNEQLVQFSGEPASGEIVIPVQNFLGVPIITIGVNGRVMRVFFDTAAPMSYLLPDAFKGLQAYGRQEDFYPLLGNFLTDVYHLPVNIGGECRELRFGELPEELRTVLDAGGVQGILGTEILKHFGMCLSLRDGVMKLETPYGIPRDALRA